MATEVPVPSAGWVQRVLIGRDPKRTLARLFIWVILAVLTFKFALLPIRIEGISMYPTYKDRGVNFVNRLAYLFHEPRRGDVVAIKMAGEHVMYLKRIIALPGETLAFREGKAVVNGRVLDEPYVKDCHWDVPADIIGPIGPDEYYVVGDNRSMEFGEHYRGRAERSRIIGRIVL